MKFSVNLSQFDIADFAISLLSDRRNIAYFLSRKWVRTFFPKKLFTAISKNVIIDTVYFDYDTYIVRVAATVNASNQYNICFVIVILNQEFQG